MAETGIEYAVEEALKKGTGRLRFLMTVEGLSFFSEPLKKEAFLMKWHILIGHADLSRVQYESKSEYTPGNHIWQNF